MTITYKEKYGKPLVAIEKGDEIRSYNVVVSGVYTLPDEECIEVFLQGDSDFYIGDVNIQNILIPAGGILTLDINNTNIITISGNSLIKVMVLK